MKTILTILTTAIVAMSVVSCKTKDKEVKKLPSKMEYISPRHHGISIFEYFYDEQNRLIKIATLTGNSSSVLHHPMFYITYNSDDLPTKLGDFLPTDIMYQDNEIIIRDATLLLNDKGQFTKYFCEPSTKYFSYNSNGNFSKMNSIRSYDGEHNEEETTYNYSDIPAIWRYVNTPEWLLFWLSERKNYTDLFEKNGYLPLQKITNFQDTTAVVDYIYELDKDYYVTNLKYSYDGEKYYEYRYEYILAK